MVEFKDGQEVLYIGELDKLVGRKGSIEKAGKHFSKVDFNGRHYMIPHNSLLPLLGSDSPTKPDHYHKGGIDVFTYASANFTVDEVNAYHRITALKYITRAGKKAGNPFEQDIKKAIVHLEECLKGDK